MLQLSQLFINSLYCTWRHSGLYNSEKQGERLLSSDRGTYSDAYGSTNDKMAGLVPQVLNEANNDSFSSALGSSKDWLETVFDERVVVHGIKDAEEHSPYEWNLARLCLFPTKLIFLTEAYGISFIAWGINQ